MLKLGFGIAELNPPLGMAMEGLSQKGGIQSIHDDLYARVLWFEQAERRALIIALDLLFFARPVTDRLRGAVARQLDLKVNDILLNFSHTHAGPRCSEWHYSGSPNPLYLDKVEDAILTAVRQAASNLDAVECRAGATTTDLPVSRRKLDANGIAQWAPSPSSKVCRHLPFALFHARDGAVKAVLFSVSCHPSMIHSLDVSAEFPGVAVRRLNTHFRTAGSVFLQGAGGDAKPRQIAGEAQWRAANWEQMEAAGREVADAVIGASAGGLIKVEPDLRAVSRETRWPLAAPLSPAEFQKLAESPQTCPERRAWARDMLARIALFGRLPEAVPMTLQGVQLGKGLRLVALECELVGELGNLIVSEYPDGVTFPLGYSNGCAIYLPSDGQLPQHGYEVDSFWEYHWPAPLAPGIDARLRQSVRELKAKGIC